MKLTQKRICGDCKALELSKYGGGCSIGFKTEWRTINGHKDIVPAEPCSKPLTNTQLISELNKTNS